VPVQVVSEPILQAYYDHVLPGASAANTEHDEDQVENSDITLHVENLNIDMSRHGQHARKIRDRLRFIHTKLRTAQPNRRTTSQRQSLLALQKRNCDTPANGDPVDLEATKKRVFDKFAQKFLRKDYS
jgi:hypothetical protein